MKNMARKALLNIIPVCLTRFWSKVNHSDQLDGFALNIKILISWLKYYRKLHDSERLPVNELL